MNLLKKVSMNAKSMIEGKKYIWRVDENRSVVAWLNDTGDGLSHYEDEWFFKDNLIGEIFGPFELNLQTLKDKEMYYLEKQGVYSQGIYWIGEQKEQGIIEADLHAKNDDDDYHTWNVYEYNYGFDDEEVYETKKPKLI